jgi:cytosine permease
MREESSFPLPPILRKSLEDPPLARRPWYQTIGPAYLGIFVWAPFFDALWVGGLTHFPLPWLCAEAVGASLLCFTLFYYIPASWGFQTRQPLAIVAASTFGTIGSEWITGVAVAIAALVWYTVAIDYAVDSTLLGLRACGMVGPESLLASRLGPVVVKSPVYFTTALFWIYITGTSSLWKITGVVVALMKVYAPIALLLLTSVALLLVSNLRSYAADTVALLAAQLRTTQQWQNHRSVVELMTGFFALAGLSSVDWGATAQRRRDVVMGGVTGIVLPASWTAIMSLLVVAGAIASVGHDSPWLSPHETFPLTFRWAVYYGIGGIPGGAILILFGLAALAPACYSAWVYSQKLTTHWPRLGHTGWTWSGGAIALALGGTGYASRLDAIFFAMGVMFAPAIGAMAGDWLVQKGTWPGIRPGVNRTGVFAWAAGLGIALAVEVGRVEGPGSAPWWYSSAICGFVVAFAYYSLLARLGRESPAVRFRQAALTDQERPCVERLTRPL